MMAMYTRMLDLPARSFLMLGPRSTGKTTWLRSLLPDARWYNLLLDRELLRLQSSWNDRLPIRSVTHGLRIPLETERLDDFPAPTLLIGHPLRVRHVQKNVRRQCATRRWCSR
jgi:hypothetical protein